jgi:GT2 family glycosyltransferase
MRDSTAVGHATILVVVVLYRSSLAAAQTLQGLATAFAANPSLLRGMEVLVWDNGPEAIADPQLPFPFTYVHAEHNQGVAGAYNGASARARKRGHNWMLLFDQDTCITEEFLLRCQEYGSDLAGSQEIAAIVPFLYAGTFQLSPRRLTMFSQPPIPAGKSYIERRKMFAANSGTMVRVDALKQIGGYSLDFWLDHSDRYVFHQFHRQGFSVFVAADLRLQHELAMLDYDRRMTPERYRNFLDAEAAFDALYNGWPQRTVQTLRLPIRALRQRRYQNKVYRRMTMQAFWRRVLKSRKRWLDTWLEGRT